MEFETARTRFHDRLYSWSKEQASKEFQGCYQLLQRVRASDVLRAIEIVRSLPQSEGFRLALLCIRGAHRDAAARVGETITAQEETWLGRYRSSHAIASREEIRIRGWNVTQEHLWIQLELAAMAYPFRRGRSHVERPEPLDRPSGVLEAARRFAEKKAISKLFVPRGDLSAAKKKAEDARVLAEWSRFKIDRKRLRLAVTTELTRALCVKGKKESSREVLYEVPIGRWVVWTLVDYGSGKPGGFQLRYFQGIRHTSDPEFAALLPTGINTMSWLGPGVPHWNLLTNDDLEEAAVVLAILCSRFTEAACSFVQGLDD